jgi:hypothetical protein
LSHIQTMLKRAINFSDFFQSYDDVPPTKKQMVGTTNPGDTIGEASSDIVEMMKMLVAEEDIGQFRCLKGKYGIAARACRIKEAEGRVVCQSAHLCPKKHPVHMTNKDGAILATNYTAVLADEHGCWLQIHPRQIHPSIVFKVGKHTGRTQEYSWLPVTTKDGFSGYFSGIEIPAPQTIVCQPDDQLSESIPKLPQQPPNPSSQYEKVPSDIAVTNGQSNGLPIGDGNVVTIKTGDENLVVVPKDEIVVQIQRKGIGTMEMALNQTGIKNTQSAITGFFKTCGKVQSTIAMNKGDGDKNKRKEEVKVKPKHSLFARGFYYFSVQTIWALDHE